MEIMDLATVQNTEQLIQWFAVGHSAEEVAILARDELDMDWNKQQAKAFARKYAEDISSYLKQHSDSLLHRISIAHKPIRVQKIENLCELLAEGVKECTEQGKWGPAAKLADTILKAYRLVGEETHDLARPIQGMNVYVQLIQAAPPERRKEIARRVAEIEQLLSANPDAIDADFIVSESEAN